MANQIQRLIYEGYLAGEPELRYTPSGRAVVNFRIGSTSQYRKDEEVVKETTWLKIVAWGELAEIVKKYCVKGTHVIVEGKLRPGENGSPDVFQLKSGQRAGEWASSFEVTASSVRILGNGSSSKGETSADDDELPFE